MSGMLYQSLKGDYRKLSSLDPHPLEVRAGTVAFRYMSPQPSEAPSKGVVVTVKQSLSPVAIIVVIIVVLAVVAFIGWKVIGAKKATGTPTAEEKQRNMDQMKQDMQKGM